MQFKSPDSFSFSCLEHCFCFLLCLLLLKLMVELHQQLLCKLLSRTIDTAIVEYLQPHVIILHCCIFYTYAVVSDVTKLAKIRIR